MQDGDKHRETTLPSFVKRAVVVQRYAGRITVESATGKGTTFRFTLPAAVLPG